MRRTGSLQEFLKSLGEDKISDLEDRKKKIEELEGKKAILTRNCLGFAQKTKVTLTGKPHMATLGGKDASQYCALECEVEEERKSRRSRRTWKMVYLPADKLKLTEGDILLPEEHEDNVVILADPRVEDAITASATL